MGRARQADGRRVMAQIAMVMNLDKCIGCHTCSVTCKQAWTNRGGVEYVWFNNVETRPGQGYPRRYEDQDTWRGGWKLDRRGRLRLKAGGRLRKLATIFSNPTMPGIQDYYEPWTYDYKNLTDAPLGEDIPVARPRSLLTGRPTRIEWSANWDDDLGGMPEKAGLDPVLAKLRQQAAETAEKVKLAYEQTFMFYLPRICEHCLNPSCVASCPSGAMYKRTEDGIVLVDQDTCKGWRMCVTGCPYKKVYFNHKTGKAEKCTFCYPRVEVGLPTVCSETCVGRLRHIGVVLYDPDAVLEAAATPDETDLHEAQLGVFLDPEDPEVRRDAERAGIPHDWIEAARRSPVYALVSRHRVALPLHPEYRTLPMVWYVPPLSPVVDALNASGLDGEDPGNLFGAIDTLRIPLEYLAELFSAGDTGPVRAALEKLAAMRAHMRRVNLGEEPPRDAPGGADSAELEELYRLLALARYEERYVIPTAAVGDARRLEESALPQGCSLDYEGGPGMGGLPPGKGALGEGSGREPPVAVENFHALGDRQTADRPAGRGKRRVNLLNWDGNGRPDGLFPDRTDDQEPPGPEREEEPT
ncbi:nitrate reductase subunit beta [Streptomyces cacaoi]|uniref:nitrate reductase subunit beta n=1 Tax=Streptomyces cacaoi TaxID=1898 RepID=UPI00374A33DC